VLKAPFRDLLSQLYRNQHHPVHQSQVSRVLASEYQHLDALEETSTDNTVARKREAHNPRLEELLFEWQQRLQAHGQIIIGSLLKERAERFWNELQLGSTKPAFLNGWLQGFKTRHKIRGYRLHGEGSSIDQTTIAEGIEKLQQALEPCPLRDIYNMDETGLF
jgi:hypothetical protein